MDEIVFWFLPLVMALLVGILCPVMGTLLVTQRRVLQANLISHAVLPGLALSVALVLTQQWEASSAASLGPYWLNDCSATQS